MPGTFLVLTLKILCLGKLRQLATLSKIKDKFSRWSHEAPTTQIDSILWIYCKNFFLFPLKLYSICKYQNRISIERRILGFQRVKACLKVSKWMQEGLFLVKFHLQFNNVNSGGQNSPWRILFSTFLATLLS